MTAPILELSLVSKDYHGLRPLRVEQLVLVPADRIAILGWDQMAAEMFVNLVTGTSLPDQGEVRVFGRPTSSISQSDEWLAVVDRFGIVTPRAVLLESLSVIQNLAVPFTLDIEPPPPDARARAAALAGLAGLPEPTWDQPVGSLDAAAQARVRLGRALALEPAILLLEHPTAGVPRPEIAGLARQFRETADRQGAALLALTADEPFAKALDVRILRPDLKTGRLIHSGRRAWFW